MSNGTLLGATPLVALLKLLADARATGKRIVFTNGIFDLVHTGHIRYLRAARALGDVLVVGVNSDESTRKLKGESRPILPQSERVKIIAALEPVDYVAVFAEDTPLKLIEAVAPDVLVKGNDYTLDEIVGRNEVECRGGRVVTVPLVDGKSSSNVVERIVRSASNTD